MHMVENSNNQKHALGIFGGLKWSIKKIYSMQRGFNVFRFSLCRLQNLDAAVCCLSESPKDGDPLREWNIHELRPAGIPHSGVKVLKTQKVYKQKLFSIHKNELNTEPRDSSMEVTILNV